MKLVKIEDVLKSDRQAEYLEALEEFQYIALVENYLEGDAEGFHNPNDYIDLLKELRSLTCLNLEEIEGFEEDRKFVFTFQLSGQKQRISIPKPTADWLDESIADEFNQVLENLGIKKGIYFVFAAGMDFATQIFHLVYIERSIYQELLAHEAGYVFNPER